MELPASGARWMENSDWHSRDIPAPYEQWLFPATANASSQPVGTQLPEYGMRPVASHYWFCEATQEELMRWRFHRTTVESRRVATILPPESGRRTMAKK